MDNNGYIKNTPTQDKFWSFANPHYQRYIALTQGYVTTMHEDFTYVEIGCGTAFSLCVHAAANPKAKFIGIDITPEYIEAGEQTIKKLKLKNVTLINAAVSEETDLTEEFDIPEADFVFTHKLLSWVSPEVRIAIFELIGHILVPGGIAFTSYDSLPGSAHRQTIHHIAQSYREAISDDVERVEAAFNFINFLHQNASHFALQNNVIAMDIANAVNDPEVATHMYGNENYEPLWFADVSREMNTQGLVFCGTTSAANNNAHLVIPESALEALGSFPDTEALEFVKDMFGNTEYRADLYIRPMETEIVVGEILSKMRFLLVMPRNLVTLSSNVPVGVVELSQEAVGPMLDKLVRGDALTNLDAAVFNTLVGISLAIDPEVRNTITMNANVHRAFIDEQLENSTAGTLTIVSGLVGSGVHIPKVSMLLYLCGSHGAAKKWLTDHPDSSIDIDELEGAVKHRDDFEKLINKVAPDL